MRNHDDIKNIRVKIKTDDNERPVGIIWSAPVVDVLEKEASSLFIAAWDKEEQKALRLDLWTRTMRQNEMKAFVHDIMLSTAQTLEQATGELEMAAEIRAFCDHFAKKMEIGHKE